jgi:hypothetical protein
MSQTNQNYRTDTADSARERAEEAHETEIEVTEEMIEAVDGMTVSENDRYTYRRKVYAQIFSNMLLAYTGPLLKTVCRVVRSGEILGEKPAAAKKVV